MIDIQVFLLELLDKFLSTLKTICVIKNKNLLAALMATIATGFHYCNIMIVQGGEVTGSQLQRIGVIMIAVFLGVYLSQFVANKFSKDKVWIFDIKAPTREEGKYLADQMRENRLAVMTCDGYNDNKEKVINCKIYSQNKEQSKLIEELIPCHFRYSVIEVKNYIN